jgi:eukaryotic-like serine/threonine-protein kinase
MPQTARRRVLSWAVYRDNAGGGIIPAVGARACRELATEHCATGNLVDDQDATGLGFARGGTIGRYIVLSLIGKGGMGIVYAAYDPELDRKVALKLLRIRDDLPGSHQADKRARLLREAKATARLSHPNVIVVFDVGTIEDRVFIAMELVDGVTITRWRESRPRSWKEVLRVFTSAGHGLAAAHAAGIVHRDFKPDNVMVGRDDKVRVMDFGLARQVETPREEAVPEALGADGEDSGLGTSDLSDGISEGTGTAPSLPFVETRLTHDGMVVGTPAYMPPEQYLGKSDARTDQFSFCVALYECLYGEHPFEGKTAFGIAGDAHAGRVREPPAGTRVPVWLRRVVLRGMRPRPEDRYPSMEALLAALEKDPAVASRRWLVAGSVLAAFGSVGFAVRQAADSRQALCAAGPAHVATAWELPLSSRGAEPPRHAAVRHAFQATGKSYAEDTLRGVLRALDDYATRWVALYRETCEATRVHGDQSEEVLDLRMSCLNDRLGGLKALTDVFSEATGEVVERAVDAARALTPLDRCSDVKQLRALIPPPGPDVKVKVEALRHEMTRIKALHDAGRYADVVTQLAPIVKETKALDYRPLEAEVMMRLALAEMELNQPAKAEADYDRALTASLASRHDDLLAEIAASLVWVAGFQAQFSEAERWMRIAGAAIERTSRPDPVAYSWLLNNSGAVYFLQGRYGEALEYFQRALSLKETSLGPENPDVAISAGNIALTLNALERGNEALEASNRAVRIVRLCLGNSHPRVADQLNNRGEILASLGRLSEALEAYGEARTTYERESGANDPTVAYALTGIGITLTRMRRAAEAIAPLQRALDIREAHDPDPARLGETMFALARALWESGTDAARAVVLGREARSAYHRAPLSREHESEVTAWLTRHEREQPRGITVNRDQAARE